MAANIAEICGEIYHYYTDTRMLAKFADIINITGSLLMHAIDSISHEIYWNFLVPILSNWWRRVCWSLLMGVDVTTVEFIDMRVPVSIIIITAVFDKCLSWVLHSIGSYVVKVHKFKIHTCNSK